MTALLSGNGGGGNAGTGGDTINLSLISHTNVGKTTLARTLIGRDIGEVRDEAHVTTTAEVHLLIDTPAGDRLMLWDTPGFGDSVRLARRLAQAGNPIGWFMSELWDRYRDRPFWLNQRAVRHVLDEADVVLYLVNASETPEDAGYLDAELKVLALIGKPVIVLLNQLGAPQPAAAQAADVQRWRVHTSAFACVRDALALDAFTRCWVQESRWLGAVSAVLPPSRRAAFERLRQGRLDAGRGVWRASMQVLAQRLARAALDREEVPGAGWRGRLQEVGAAIGLRGDAATPREQAMQQLARRLEADVRQTTDRLIALHGLQGRAAAVVLERMAEHFAAREPVSEGKAAAVGGAVAGALAGLKADLISGGLTMGGGALAGGVIGALGALGLARGFNVVRGVERPTLAWSAPMLDELFRTALVSYLAVAHFGRGRGEWAAAEDPAFWQEAAGAALESHRERLRELWSQRDESDPAGFQTALFDLLAEASAALLMQLHPDAPLELFDSSAIPAPAAA